MKPLPDSIKRAVYKQAFLRDYNSPNRKQAPLPLDIAFQIAMLKLKGE